MKKKSKAKLIIALGVVAILIWGVVYYLESGTAEIGLDNSLTAQVSGGLSSSSLLPYINIQEVDFDNFTGRVEWSSKNVGNNWIGRVFVRNSQNTVIYNSGDILLGSARSHQMSFPYLDGFYTVGVFMRSPNGAKSTQDVEQFNVNGMDLDLSVRPSGVYPGSEARIEWDASDLPSGWRGELRVDGDVVKSGLDSNDYSYNIENGSGSTDFPPGSHDIEIRYVDSTGRYILSEEGDVYFFR